MKSPKFSLILVGGLVSAAVLAPGCDSAPPEDRLAAAGEAVSETSERTADLESEIEAHEEALQQLRLERRKANARLQSLEERLAARATDVAIFRAVQIALLESTVLQEAAISVNVEDKTVTLTGAVDNPAQRDKALEIARNTAGVSAVLSRIQVTEQTADAR